MTPSRITILDKTFEKSVSESEIQSAVEKLVLRLKADYVDRNPVFVVVLNGAFVFASDIIRLIDFPCELSFTKIASYDGLSSSGSIVEQLPVSEEISGRHVVIIEDIVETGYTMQFLVNRIKCLSPASVEICAFSFKPNKLLATDVRVKYVGMTLPDAFIVGYGLDYQQQGRYLRDIYSLVKE